MVCFDDAVASRVQRYLHQHQEELALVSFESGAKDSTIVGLELCNSLAATAVNMLAEQMTTGKPAASRTIPWTLNLRQSG